MVVSVCVCVGGGGLVVCFCFVGVWGEWWCGVWGVIFSVLFCVVGGGGVKKGGRHASAINNT
jgi:hypothetical protein